MNAEGTRRSTHRIDPNDQVALKGIRALATVDTHLNVKEIEERKAIEAEEASRFKVYDKVLQKAVEEKKLSARAS